MRKKWFRILIAQLHWIISDENESITVESMSDGLHIYDNPVGVLTNNPPFPQQMFQLNNYMYLSPKILSAKIWLLMHIVEVWED